MTEVAQLLEQAHAAALQGRLVDTLEPLREAWARTRDPGLAEVIEHVDRACAHGFELTGRTKQQRDRAWERVLADHGSAALGFLLAQIDDRSSAIMLGRIEALTRIGPDPRSARAMLGLLAAPPFTSSGAAIHEFWTGVRELLCASADPRSVGPLAQLASEYPYGHRLVGRRSTAREQHGVRVHDSLAALRAACEAWPVALDESARTQLDALRLAVSADPRAGTTARELLEAVWAAPDDDAPRQVYADYLLGLGDPRGEFIALQLADACGDLDARGQARMRRLWQAHGGIWLGGLAALPRESVEFRRGFLARCLFSTRLSDRQIDAVHLRTIEVLEHPPIDLLLERELPCLRELHCNELNLITALRDRPQVLVGVVRLRVELTTNEFIAELRRLLERPGALPSLREVVVTGRWNRPANGIDWLWSGPLGTRVEQVELAHWFGPQTLRTIVDELRGRLSGAQTPRLRDRLLARRPGLRSFVVQSAGYRWTLSRDDEDGPWATLHLRRSGAIFNALVLRDELAAMAGTALRLRWDTALVDVVDDATLRRLHELGTPEPATRESARGSGSRAPSSGE